MTSTHILVMASGVGPCPALAAFLARKPDTKVALITDQDSAGAKTGDRVTSIKGTFTSRANVDAAIAKAVSTLGSIHHVVMSAVPARALQPGDIASMPYSTWSESSHAPIKAVLYGLQASATHLSSGGTITLLGPTVSLVGAERLLPLCTAVEAQRSLLKSAARQWGARGIRLNWVAVASASFASELANQPLPQVPELGPPPPALKQNIDIETDLAPVVAFLGSEGARAMTGMTINIDGGDWMVP